MPDTLRWLERVARSAYTLSEKDATARSDHPFEYRDIHPCLPPDVRRLFDNGHYAQATFEAYKYLDNEIKRHSGLDQSGKALMMTALGGASPLVLLGDLSSETGRNEQEGLKFIFAGSMMSIRNPRGHEHSVDEDVNTCLDHLGLASHLIRRLARAGYFAVGSTK